MDGWMAYVTAVSFSPSSSFSCIFKGSQYHLPTSGWIYLWFAYLIWQRLYTRSHSCSKPPLLLEAGQSMRSTQECGPSVAAFAWQWISLVILDPCGDQISNRWQIVKGMSCAVCNQAWHRVRGSSYAKTKQFYETGGDGASWLVFYHHKISL